MTDEKWWTDQVHPGRSQPTSEEGTDVSSHTGLMADSDQHRLSIHGLSATLPCRDHPADLWFAELPEDVELAKALCADCPIRQQCLASALERSEPWGVWGGQLVLQGTVVPRKRPRGRPRKNPVAA
jgi:WhiB family transcriptional regulator, redox-sensing transcriptional regulator